MKHRRFLPAVFLALLLAAFVGMLVILAGRDLVDSDQVRQGSEPAALGQAETLGQTFVARHQGLSGIEFFLIPGGTLPQTITLHLRADAQATDDLCTSTLQLHPGAASGFYRFALPPQVDSHSRYYYAFLDTDQTGTSVPLADGASYLDGAAYYSHQPLDAQTSFRLVYAWGQVLLGLLRSALGWIGLLAAAGFLFVMPGWALLEGLRRRRNLSWAEMLGLSTGASLALVPLLFLWTDLVGLHLGPVYAWLPASLGALSLVWRHRRWRPRRGWQSLRQWASAPAAWSDVALVLILGLVIAVRLLAVNSLDAPLWGDGYQHTLISQLLVDNGGLFSSWEPYVAIERFAYHFGFHADVAEIHWLTGLPAVAATLQTGQLLNALAVLAVYPLAVRVTGSPWAGVWAVLLAGLLSPMPMYYTNWGRYAQLAGQVILPGAAWLTWEALEQPERRWGLLVLSALAVGGLALTHFRVLIYYVAFVLALVLLTLRRRSWGETLIRTGAVGVGAGVLFLPWFLRGFQGNILATLSGQLSTMPAQTDPSLWEYNSVGNLGTYLPPIVWLAMVAGLGLALWKHQRAPIVIGLWCGLLLLVANPVWLGLPGTGAINNFAVFIAAYLPAGLLSGVVAAELSVPAGKARWTRALLLLSVVGLGVWGARSRLGDLDPGRHVYVTRPDVRAAAWIQAHTPSQARFAVNSSFAYGGFVVVGTDGGWWLPLLALRHNTVPPLSYAMELRPDSLLRQQVEGLAHQIQLRGPNDPAVLDLFAQLGVTYVYVGQRHGQVNSDRSVQFEPDTLLRSSNYRLVYHQDRVWILAIKD